MPLYDKLFRKSLLEGGWFIQQGIQASRAGIGGGDRIWVYSPFYLFLLLLVDCGLDAFNRGCTILKTNKSFKWEMQTFGEILQSRSTVMLVICFMCINFDEMKESLCERNY